MYTNPKFIVIATLTLLLLITPTLSGCGGPPTGSASDGKRWYAMHNCAGCHGDDGVDGGAVEIAGLDMNFSSFVRKLRTKDAPIMPPFPEEKVSKQDAADIYLYLKSL